MEKDLKNLLREKKIRIFIINYEPLKERREYLKKKIKEIGLEKEVEWLIQKKRQYQNIIKKIYKKDEKKWKEIYKYVDCQKDIQILNEGEINLFLNHLKLYEKIVKEKIPISLILEDDIIINRDFKERLIKSILKLPKDFDVAYTDAGTNLRLNKEIEKIKYKEHKGQLTRTTASYFISYSGAKKFLKEKNIYAPIDIWMRYYEIKNSMKVYWLKGYLTYQGSIYVGFYKTVLQKEEASSFIKKIIFNLAKKRFNEDLLSRIEIFLLDYFFFIPYRKIRLILKNLSIFLIV